MKLLVNTIQAFLMLFLLALTFTVALAVCVDVYRFLTF